MLELTPLIELLLVALLVALVTQRTGRPYTIALVIWGLALGMLQVFEPIELSKELVLTVILPPLLFSGALHIKAAHLKPRAALIAGLAIGGTLLTAVIVGAAAHLLLGFDWLTGLLLGVIIAPTDPVSVLASFRANQVDEELAAVVETESLFNDGVAVVLYVLLLEAIGGAPLDPVGAIGEFALVGGGGVALGLGAGYAAGQFLGRSDDHLLEVTSTLIAAFGAFLAAEAVHVSGVIAVGVAGLVLGNRGLQRASDFSRDAISLFWEIVAFLVNSVIFLLIGFELSPAQLVDDLPFIGLSVAALLGARALVAYGLGAMVDRRWHNLPRVWRHVIFWGGMRGAVPVALALGLPAGLPGRSQLVSIVFGVVGFSLLVQGLTMPALLGRLGLTRRAPHAPAPEFDCHETTYLDDYAAGR